MKTNTDDEKMKENENAVTVSHLPGIDPGSRAEDGCPAAAPPWPLLPLQLFLKLSYRPPSPPTHAVFFASSLIPLSHTRLLLVLLFFILVYTHVHVCVCIFRSQYLMIIYTNQNINFLYGYS